MCYLSLVFNTLFTLAFLGIFYWYVRARLNVRVPLMLLGFVFLALQVDAMGNFFRMYGRQFGPMQYDEFSHLMVQVLVSPIIVWFVTRALHAYGYRLPLKTDRLLRSDDSVQSVRGLRDHRAVGRSLLSWPAHLG
jgi:hypothetical protein